MDTPIYTIGIAGGSGSGKTVFITEIAKQFSPQEICILSQDNYYKPIEEQTTDLTGLENFDLPESIDHERFYDDLKKLKRGEPLTLKEYTFNHRSQERRTLHIAPAPIIIIEGLFVHYFPNIADELDLKIFIEAKDYLKLSRRIVRDNKERGYDLEDVLYRFEHHVMPVYEKMLKPLKHQADLVIPNNRHFRHALEVLTLSLRARLSKL